MRLAIALGRRNLGRTWPNPSVGAVVVDPSSGVILGQGVTARGGRPHAEPNALAAAGVQARGATLYVSLEPCSHQGKTPPCVDAVVAAGIGRVVTALTDPDIRVAGRGHALLREAGIAVATDVLAGEAAQAHLGHVTRVTLGRPAVTVKLARTLDGFAGSLPGRPRLMISCERGWERTHLLRARADAIMVGVGTVIADDPGLDVRLPGLADRSPVRVVLDGSLRLPVTSRLVRSAADRPLWVLCGDDADAAQADRLAEAGVHVLRSTLREGGRELDLDAALTRLGERGLTRVFCEGGPTLADRLGRVDLIDELILSTSDHVIAGEGVPAVGPDLGRALRERFRATKQEQVGADRLAFFERSRCSPAS